MTPERLGSIRVCIRIMIEIWLISKSVGEVGGIEERKRTS
jgi:hypothetical protein